MPAPLKLPEDYRRAFKLKPPEAVLGIERTSGAWLGFGSLSSPVWVEADEPLSPQTLARWITERPIDPSSVSIPIPPHLIAPNGRTMEAVLSGQNPHTAEDQCDMGKELRLILYAYEGKTANRVLEWTAANCALGRAASIVLDATGELSIGYSNGATTTFTWSQDHFEQTQLGERDPFE